MTINEDNKKAMKELGMSNPGPINAKETYDPVNEQFSKIKKNSNILSKEGVKKHTGKFPNQKKSIKISEDAYNKLKVIKNMENFKFDYEAIQLLIDSYYHNLGKTDKSSFDMLYDVLRK